MAEVFIEGIEKVISKLDRMDFSSNEQKNIIRRVARKGGNILKDEVKRLIPVSSNYPFGAHIKKSVKVTTSKSRFAPGVNVFTKGSDVPFDGRWWKIGGYQNLYFFGNYKTPNRPTRRGRKNRGNVRGATGYNPYTLAGSNKGKRALIVMATAMKKEAVKEWRKR